MESAIMVSKSADSRTEKMKAIYSEALKFLNEIAPENVQSDGLEKYFDASKDFKDKNRILHVMLGSLQSQQRSPKVIAFWKREPVFKEILFDYDCCRILTAYNAESLLEKFCDSFNVSMDSVESRHSLWRKYAKSVMSACEFLNSFNDANDFDEFVSQFAYNECSAAALPMLIEREVFGMGFALACDFLKGLGYTEYPKPDVHVMDMFSAFGLCDRKAYNAYKAVIEMARAVNETPYKVDTIFWLIGSGEFYRQGIRIGSNKAKFIDRYALLCQCDDSNQQSSC